MRKFYSLALLLLFSASGFGQVNHLVISQIYGSGGNSGATYTNDYVEIYNPTNSVISLTGYSVQYAASGTTGSSFSLIANLSGNISAGKYYLIQAGGGSVGASLPIPDATGNLGLSATSGKVVLSSNPALVGISSSGCPTSSVVDFVSYGSGVNCFDGSSYAPAGSATNATSRINNGCIDTDNNSADFTSSLPTDPHNSSSPAHLCIYASDIVINQFSPEYNNAADEYVELVNKTNKTIDLSKLSLNYKNASGVSQSQNLLSGIIAPNSFWLLSPNPTVIVGKTNLASDGVFAPGMVSPNGQIGLFSKDNSYRFDAVAYGNITATSNTFFEGSPTVAHSLKKGYKRIEDGLDTDNNNNDFIGVLNSDLYLRNSSSRLANEGSSISGGSYMDIHVTGNASISGAVQVSNVLNISSGSLATNNNLTLKSTATSTARIAEITSIAPTPINGNVTVERFIAGGTNNTSTNTYRRAFRFLAHPFNSDIALSQLNNSAVEAYDIDITGTGGAANGFTPTGSNNPSAFWYDPITGSDAEDANGVGWKAFTNTNGVAPNSWAKGQGIRVFVRGKKGEGLSGAADYTQSDVTLDMTGSLNVGNQTINLTTAGPSIYQLIGNPYASPINLKTLGRTNVGNAYYVWNLGLGGGKGGYTTVDLSNSTPYILPAYSSFFATVTALNTTANILFKESDKTGDAPTNILFRTADDQGALKLQLKTGDILWDEFVLNNNADALATQDAYDATKLYNPDANLYSLITGGKELAIDYRNIQPNEVVRLAMYANVKRNYTIHVDDAGITSTKSVYLVDKFTNQRTLLLQGVDYNFTVNDDAASQGENRFELEFVLNTTLPITFSNLKAYQKGTGIQVEWQTATETAGSKYNVERSANGISFAAISSVNAKGGNATLNSYTIYDASPFTGNNFYRIQSIDPSGQIKRSAVVKVALGKLSSGFAVYPNPVKDNRLNIQLNNLKAGKYNVTLINSKGQQVYVTNINHAGGSVNYNLQVPSLPRGNYQLSMRSGGILLTQKVAFQ